VRVLEIYITRVMGEKFDAFSKPKQKKLSGSDSQQKKTPLAILPLPPRVHLFFPRLPSRSVPLRVPYRVCKGVVSIIARASSVML
jgi:hypothetical protein